ncbi:MAG: DinB family protein [bacterium]
MRDLLLNLLAHMRWADALVADTLERAPRPDAEAERLFAHIASVEHVWHARTLGRQPDYAIWPSLSAADSRALAARQADLYDQLVTDGGDTGLSVVVDYRNTAGHPYRSTVGEIITHVAMHGSHHRGQIARQLRGAGIEPPSMDYIQFARRDR